MGAGQGPRHPSSVYMLPGKQKSPRRTPPSVMLQESAHEQSPHTATTKTTAEPTATELWQDEVTGKPPRPPRRPKTPIPPIPIVPQRTIEERRIALFKERKLKAAMCVYPRGPVERKATMQKMNVHHQHVYSAQAIVNTNKVPPKPLKQYSSDEIISILKTPSASPRLSVSDRIDLFFARMPNRDEWKGTSKPSLCQEEPNTCELPPNKTVAHVKSKVREMSVYNPPERTIPKNTNVPHTAYTRCLDSAYQGGCSSVESRGLTIQKRLDKTAVLKKRAVLAAKLEVLRKRAAKTDEDMPYLKFMTNLTREVLKWRIFTNHGLKQMFKTHIQYNSSNLDPVKVKHCVEMLRINIGVPKSDTLNHLGYGYGSVVKSSSGQEYSSVLKSSSGQGYGSVLKSSSGQGYGRSVRFSSRLEYDSDPGFDPRRKSGPGRKNGPGRKKGPGRGAIPVRKNGRGQEAVPVRKDGHGREGVPVRKDGHGREGVPVRKDGHGREGVPVRKDGHGREGVHGRDGVPVRKDGHGREGVPGRGMQAIALGMKRGAKTKTRQEEKKMTPSEIATELALLDLDLDLNLSEKMKQAIIKDLT